VIRKRGASSFQRKTSLDRSTSMREIDGLTRFFLNFMFQRSHHDFSEVKLCCGFLCGLWYHQQKGLGGHLWFSGDYLHSNCTEQGRRRNLVVPLTCISWFIDISPSEFSVGKE
jgi:hypothetical protein